MITIDTASPAPFALAARRSTRSPARVWAVLIMVILCPPGNAVAKSSGLSVTTSAGPAGSLVSGIIVISNAAAKSETVTSLRTALEVRFPSGVTPPSLPAGLADGWYVVASVSLPAPGVILANGSKSVAFSLDTCGSGVPRYPGAKDMRSVAVVVVGGRTYTARSLNFALPDKCAVCGNGILETGEQCDQGRSGGACCSAACRFRANGTACSDGNACTRTDQCDGGTCVGSNPMECSAADACHNAGTCNPATGQCSNPAKANGSACDDHDACTQSDACQSGICRGGNPIVCGTVEPCQEASCDPGTGACSGRPKADGTECIDGDACTVGDQCVGGTCVSGAGRDCNDHKHCTDDACEAATGCAHEDAPTCSGCDAAECRACGDACDAAAADCSASCWSTFLSCLDGCTTTYCAPFCQADLGLCLNFCSGTSPCRAECEAGNGCNADCVEP